MSEQRFLVAAVVACYNVDRFLPDFFASLERQTVGIQKVQLVFVDDGSTDGTLSTLQDWASGRPDHTIVITQPNAWVAAARNAGIALVDADWVTFTDPDDALDDKYFEEVFKFIGLHGSDDVDMLAAHQMRMTDDGAIVDNHPLRRKFLRGSRIVDLEIEPVIQMSVNSAFFRVQRIRDSKVSFDGRVRPVFEDAHFVASYLLLTGGHVVGLMASAKYHYRIRSDGTSLMQTYFHRPEKYISVPRYGHLDLLHVAEAQGRVPRWLENILLYDVFWYFKDERGIRSPTAVAPPEVFDEFHALMAEVTSLISEDAIRSFDSMWVEEGIRMALVEGYRTQRYRPATVNVDRVDEDSQTVKLSYWFSGDLPEELYSLDAENVEPVHSTTQEFVFFERTLMKRRIVWLTRGRSTTVTLDGRRQHVTYGQQDYPSEVLDLRQLRPQILAQREGFVERFSDLDETTGHHLRRKLGAARGAVRTYFSHDARADRKVEWALRSRKNRDRFAHAWVFMDRNTDANDNAEHLYRHVKAAHPEINSWFVLDRDSRDWTRLEAEGFRLVAYGSFDWRLLLLHADHLASSHIDVYVVQPFRGERYGKRRFRFSFLQHGVINYDLSRWLNSKPIDLFVTTTPQERAAIAGPSQYVFSDREVVLTGLPRHDALLRRRRAVADPDLIVVMPTWRKSLAGEQIPGSNERAKNQHFMESEFAQRFVELLSSDEISALAQASGKRIAFMPHPNIRPYLRDFALPPHIEILDFARDNVQDVLARTAAFVTDYSSLAFDAAFLDIPLVYFQFDFASFFDGTHVGRQGYFDYERDGFGPVASSAVEVVSRLQEIADSGFRSGPEYLQRTALAFVTRDERSAERTFIAMRDIG
jgi:glycosyltransferase involved in cell wall biosynthesis